MSHRRPVPPTGRALVLGASVAGLLTAAALAHRFEVVLVDRDPVEGDLDGPRRGVPQSRHTHGLLVSGTRAMDDLLPGLTDALVARGARRADVVADSRWVLGGAPLAGRRSGLEGLLCSRTLVEGEIRRRVAAVPWVSAIGGHDIVDLVTTSDRDRVVGARVAARDGIDRGVPVEILADLVVDATGRGSRAARWLADLGYPSPPVVEVPTGLTYVTRVFHDASGLLPEVSAVVVGSDPGTGSSAAALRQEGERWSITLAAARGPRPPLDLAGFAEFADRLPTALVAQVIRGSQPVTEGETFRYSTSRWVRFDRMARRPAGLLVVGDAVCSFNPVYGQGMSSAALQAVAVRDLADRAVPARGRPVDTAAAVDRVVTRAPACIARVVATPWSLATGPDRRAPGMPRKPLGERLLDRYLDRLVTVAHTDPSLAVAFLEVLNLVRPPQRLLTPSAVAKTLRPRANRARDRHESSLPTPVLARS